MKCTTDAANRLFLCIVEGARPLLRSSSSSTSFGFEFRFFLSIPDDEVDPSPSLFGFFFPCHVDVNDRTF